MFATPQRSRDDQIAWELHRRARVGVLAAGAGVLYELSASILSAVLKSVPSVGLLQGLAPALSGNATPAISPGVAEVRFINSHSLGTIGGSAVAAFSVLFTVVALDFLAQATRYRRPESLRAARPLLIIGGVGFAILSVAHEVINSIETHAFVHGHNYSDAAVVHALSTNTATVITTYIDVVIAIAFGVGVGVVSVNAMRVGLIPKLLGYVGVAAAFLYVLPLPLQLLTALWLVGVGFLILGRWPGGDPPAWESAEARPWPTAAERRLQTAGAGGGGAPPRRGLFGGGRASRDAPAAAAVLDAPPEPTAPPHPRSNKRKRRRER
jgi:hypothetical protein